MDLSVPTYLPRRKTMDIKEIIESKFKLTVNDILVLGQGLDSIAYLVNHEYIFKQSKHNDARNDL